MGLGEFRKLQLSLGYGTIKLGSFVSDLTFSSPYPCQRFTALRYIFWDDFSLYIKPKERNSYINFHLKDKHLPKAGTNVDWLCPILVVIWFVRTT